MTVLIPVREARLLIWHDGKPMPPWSADHISEQAGKVLVAAVAGAAGSACALGLGRAGAAIYAAMWSGFAIGGTLAPRSVPPKPWDENCADRLDPALYAVVRWYDADHGTFIDRQRIDVGYPAHVSVSIEPLQRVRLELSLDDGASLVSIPLTILNAGSVQTVSITIKAGPEAQAAAAAATKKAQAGAPEQKRAP